MKVKKINIDLVLTLVLKNELGSFNRWAIGYPIGFNPQDITSRACVNSFTL